MSEGEQWRKVTDMLGGGHKTLGSHWTFNVLNDPKRLGFVLSRYKFAAKVASKGRAVLELGCSEGIGAPILAEQATRYVGADLDGPAIAAAKANWTGEKFEFQVLDFLGQEVGTFDSIVSLDVIEHIHLEYEPLYLETIARNLGDDGIAVIGTPNATAAPYASPMSQEGHVNLYEQDRLAEALGKVFHTVFSFGINDETVHTGYAPMCHYIVAVGCYKR